MACWHCSNISHRDLKLENLLLQRPATENEVPAVKIADFGLAKKMAESQMRTICGTPQYVAPEVILVSLRPLYLTCDIVLRSQGFPVVVPIAARASSDGSRPGKAACLQVCRKQKGHTFNSAVIWKDVALQGTPGLMYGPAVDLWSAGVVLFILLGGYPPFYDESEPALFNQIRKGRFTFDDPVWDSVSER